MNTRGFAIGDRIQQSVNSHPDYCASFGNLGDYKFVGASAIGKLHIHLGKSRDDAFAIRSSGPWLAVAVSDGVGSRPLSRLGASFAVEALCEQMLRGASPTGDSELPEPGKFNDFEPNQSVLKDSTDHPIEDGITTHTSEVAGVETGNVPSLSLYRRLLLPIGGLMPRKRKAEVEPVKQTRALDEPIELPPSDDRISAHGTLVWYRDHSNAEIERDSSHEQRLDDRVTAAFRLSHRGLEEFACARGLRMSDVSCTLIGLLINTDTNEVAAGQVGDGLLTMYGPKPGAHPILDAPSPEGGAVYSFSGSDWEDHFVVRYLSSAETADVRTYFLMTDGVADDCTFAPPEDILQKWSGDMDRELRQGTHVSYASKRLIRWLNTYEAPGSFDDRTVVAILRG